MHSFCRMIRSTNGGHRWCIKIASSTDYSEMGNDPMGRLAMQVQINGLIRAACVLNGNRALPLGCRAAFFRLALRRRVRLSSGTRFHHNDGYSA
jgi:hypothetical protein